MKLEDACGYKLQGVWLVIKSLDIGEKRDCRMFGEEITGNLVEESQNVWR